MPFAASSDIVPDAYGMNDYASLNGVNGRAGIIADSLIHADSTVNIIDATMIQRYLAGFENIYHIGEPFGA